MEPGAVLREAWELYKTYWRHILPIALVVYLLLSLLTLLLAALLGIIGALAAAFVSLVGVFWLQGALVVAVEDIRDGRGDLSIRETLERVKPRLNTLALAGVLAGFAITVGLFLLLVPGLVLLTWWAVFVPVIVLERAGVFEALGRSRDLVRGNGWNVFGLVVLTLLVLLVVQIVLGLVLALALAPLPDSAQSYVTNVVVTTLTAPFAALVLTLAYYRLRAAREAPAEPAPAGV